MTSDHRILWGRCAFLGRVLLPLVDQEPRRQDRRQETLRTRDIDVLTGERLIEVFAALAAQAVAADEFEPLPLGVVADAATSKRDCVLRAGLPHPH